jgi:hypothetical protein
MASMHMMSGGLGDRDDDFICSSTREYNETGRSRRSDRYDEVEYKRYDRRGRR